MIDPRLGFLEARPPYHRHFSGERVRRTRAFLSKWPGPEPQGEAVAVRCGEGRKPIAHNFPVDGEMVPLGQLESILPDDILWEHTDLHSAVTLQYKSHRWWTKPVTLEEEEGALDRILREKYRGPPGSVSVHNDEDDDYIDRTVGLLEALDPHGHRHLGCFRNYFVRYREEKPFSGMHFFDWLDFGNGKFLLERAMGARSNKRKRRRLLWLRAAEKTETLRYMDGDMGCQREDFVKDTVHYFTDEERRRYEVYITPSTDGRKLIARYKHND